MNRGERAGWLDSAATLYEELHSMIINPDSI